MYQNIYKRKILGLPSKMENCISCILPQAKLRQKTHKLHKGNRTAAFLPSDLALQLIML